MPRQQCVRTNYVDVVAPERIVAYNLGHLIEVIRVGHHVTITIDDPEQAHGAGSILAIDPENVHLSGNSLFSIPGQSVAGDEPPPDGPLSVCFVANRPIEESGDAGGPGSLNRC
ncbi:MAG: hypothetical protein ACLP7Q_07495 [Isosphaeraceae bacterium]